MRMEANGRPGVTRLTGVILCAALGLAACSTGEQPSNDTVGSAQAGPGDTTEEAGGSKPDVVQANSQGWASETKFTGTPEEHSLAMRSCMGELGFEVATAADDPGRLDINMTGHSDDDVAEALDGCAREVGEPSAYLTMAELQARYDWRAEQFDCLVSEGFVSGTVKSFDSFVADYKRTGFADWSPLEGLQGSGNVKPALEACPASDEW